MNRMCMLGRRVPPDRFEVLGEDRSTHGGSPARACDGGHRAGLDVEEGDAGTTMRNATIVVSLAAMLGIVICSQGWAGDG
jgi:hypothetical protein